MKKTIICGVAFFFVVLGGVLYAKGPQITTPPKPTSQPQPAINNQPRTSGETPSQRTSRNRCGAFYQEDLTAYSDPDNFECNFNELAFLDFVISHGMVCPDGSDLVSTGGDGTGGEYVATCLLPYRTRGREAIDAFYNAVQCAEGFVRRGISCVPGGDNRYPGRACGYSGAVPVEWWNTGWGGHAVPTFRCSRL